MSQITQSITGKHWTTSFKVSQCKQAYDQFLADHTNGRAYATVLRLSVRLSVVCDVMYCG